MRRFSLVRRYLGCQDGATAVEFGFIAPVLFLLVMGIVEAGLIMSAQNTLESTPTGQTSKWHNPDSGNAGSYTPTRTYQTASGQDCREFESDVVIDGKTETTSGTACRSADGTWKITR